MPKITTIGGLTPCVAAGTGGAGETTLSVPDVRVGDIVFCQIVAGTAGTVTLAAITKDTITCTVSGGDTDSVIAYLVLRGD